MWKVALFLSLIWAVTILYGEMFAFWLPSLWTCSWPHLHTKMNGTNVGDYVKVAVLTDPQLMDKTSLRLAPKSLALDIAQFYTDLYMRRAMLSSVLPFEPDVILFLGDYFDGGPFLSDEEWQESLNRFRHIFNLNILQQTTNIKVYYLPGNHDIGYAAFHSQMPEIIRRYEKEFGARNHRFTLGRVQFIAIDAQAVDGHSHGKLTSSTWDFVKDFSENASSDPRVLLTHIPLYRPDGTSCGPHRSSPIINQRIHHSIRHQEIIYQNYVTENSTDDLLNMIKPLLVLSGHDHDQCTVTHKHKEGHVKEHTLGTISWQQGNLRPSFMLLSASNVMSHGFTSEDAILTRLCFLPNQLYIYIWYIILFVITLLVLLFGPSNEIIFLRQFGDLMAHAKSLFSSSGTKEKNEDDDCEYDMIWDAEGTMHLVKATPKTSSTHLNERVSVERGNAVMRSAARKQSTEKLDVSIPMNMDGNVGSVIPLRTSKSKARQVTRKIIRTFQVITLIAVINVPLYMMLLFKDWIDK